MSFIVENVFYVEVENTCIYFNVVVGGSLVDTTYFFDQSIFPLVRDMALDVDGLWVTTFYRKPLSSTTKSHVLTKPIKRKDHPSNPWIPRPSKRLLLIVTNLIHA